MNEDFAEYTKCMVCNQALLYCDCNCPYCGKRDGCKCELKSIAVSPLGSFYDFILSLKI